MHLIALTGGIASGKSTVSQRWAHHGAVVVDADALAREVVEPGSPALAEIESRWGSDMISSDGSLNRSALGALIFENAAARESLNAITHPAIGRLAQSRFDEAAAEDADALIVYDVPLLVESRQSLDRFDKIVTVEAGAEVQVERLIAHRGMERAEAESRVASQASSQQRRAIADFVVESNGTIEQTLSRADQIWLELHNVLLGIPQ